MSDMVDDELLGGEEEFNYEDYDISDEKEDALLEEDDDYAKPELHEHEHDADKKESASETEEQEDVLNLDIEEDFQDVEDKTMYEEDQPHEIKTRKDGKFLVERTQMPVPQKITSTSVDRSQVAKRSFPVSKTTKNVPAKVNPIKKVFQRTDRRGRGNARGNFQTRTNFMKNNLQRRRNGTVLINPRYEGTVHISENNARLAWDNSQYPQSNTNFIQPWASGNAPGNYEASSQDQLLTNLVSEIANFAQTSTNLLPQAQPPPQNFFQTPSTTYQQQLSYQPPPSLLQMQSLQTPYSTSSQVASRQMYPTSQSNVSSHQSYAPRGSQQRFTSQLSTNRVQEESRPLGSYSNYDYFSQQNYAPEPKKSLTHTNFYENKNLSYNRPNVVQNDSRFKNYTSNFSTQNDFRTKNASYDNFQNKNPTYTNTFKQGEYNYGSYNFTKNENRTNRNDSKQWYENDRGASYRVNVKQYQDINTSNKNVENKPIQHDQNKNNFNKFNTFSHQTDNNYTSNYTFNKNVDNQWNKRPVGNVKSDQKGELSEKNVKTEENTNTIVEPARDESQKAVEQKRQPINNKIINEEEEDEETRQYRLKIEEQKKEREKVLRIKEERRKQMMLQRQKQDEAKLPTTERVQKQQLPENNYQQQFVAQPTQFKRKHYFEHSAGTVSVQNPNQFSLISGSSQRLNNTVSSAPAQRPNQYYGGSNLDVSEELPNLTFKVSNNIQDPPIAVKNVLKTEASSSSFMSNRVVVVKNTNSSQRSGILSGPNVAKTVNNDVLKESSDVGQGLSSFFNNRKVLKKDNSLLNTRLVVVNNLSATTTQNKLMALTRGIGEIQTLRMDKQERQATILFKSVASAHEFFKKYQRRILDDLSVIEVKLEPMI